jgi:hypothetical protein
MERVAMDWLTKQSKTLVAWLREKFQSVSGGLLALGLLVTWWTWILLVLSLIALSILPLALSQCFSGVLRRIAEVLRGLGLMPKV